MGTDSIVKNLLKNLYRSYGWSYGVFWSFDQANSLLLTMQDAYFEEEIQGIIDDLLLQAPMFGGGLIGQASFTKKHLWMSSEDNYIGHNSSGSIWDMFRDDSKFSSQFPSGIKTIAAIPVEPQGVVQFGSTKKILERTKFIDQTKRMFHETVNGDGPAISSSPNGLFASLISSEIPILQVAAVVVVVVIFQLDPLRLFHQILSVQNLKTCFLIIIISLLTMVEILSASIYFHVNIFWRFMLRSLSVLCLYVPWVHFRGRNSCRPISVTAR